MCWRTRKKRAAALRPVGARINAGFTALWVHGNRLTSDLWLPLVTEVDQPQPRVSTHLACLRHCGFVETERRGKEIVYRLALDGLDGIMDRALSAMSPVAQRLATCTRIGPDWV